MPHKINPIDVEIVEGYLSKTNSNLAHITNSRYQRALSGSTANRHISAALACSLVGYERTKSRLENVSPNAQVMQNELAENPAVLAEAVQTILRRAGHRDAYERVKDPTRGEQVSTADGQALIDDLDIDEFVRGNSPTSLRRGTLVSLTPSPPTSDEDRRPYRVGTSTVDSRQSL